MIKDLTKPLQSSFLSCEKDAEIILRKLFVDNKTYGKILKKLLVVNTKDCLDSNNPIYEQAVENKTLKNLVDEGYILLTPKIRYDEHPDVKSIITLSFDNFIPNRTNPEFRDCTIHIDIICYYDYWDLGDYRLRPLKIMGYIDGLLNKCHLTGIGELEFMGAAEIEYSPDLAGYSLMYRAVHGSDDMIAPKDAE